MKTYSQFENILKEPILSVEPIENGLTNDNYHVTSQNHDVVFRLPKSENEGLFDYTLEGTIIEHASSLNLDVPLVYYDSQTGIKVTEYIPDTHHFTTDELKRSAALLKTLHDAKLVTGVNFHILDKYNQYTQRTKKPKYNLEPFVHFIHDAENSITHRVLCHNDVVEGNLLFTKSEAFLIDYEYASDNDPYFDVMSLLTENDIQDTALRNSFYTEYFGTLPNESMQRKLNIFECAHYVLWCSWAQMMMSSESNPVYEAIADLKFMRLKEKLTQK